MKPGRLFWGVTFLVLGVLLLMERFDLFSLQWFFVLRFWPLVLILWGIALLTRKPGTRWVAPALGGLFVALLFMGLVDFTMLRGPWGESREGPHVEDFAAPLDTSLHTASLVFESGAGSFIVGDPTDRLVTAHTESSFGSYAFSHTTYNGSEKVRVTLEGTPHGWIFGRPRNKAVLHLSVSPVWTLEFDAGAARLDADLSPYKVENVRISTGAADVKLKLGTKYERQHVRIDAGASSINVLVPDSAGCEVRANGPLSGKHIRGLQRTEEGTYRTENFSSASRRIFMEIDAGVSSINVSRY